jgi:mono/diheme cytochrome c family protein
MAVEFGSKEDIMRMLLVMVAAMAVGGVFVLTAQQGSPPSVYTAAQAAAGRTAYQAECAKCHTDKLTGRKGEPGEIPLLDSLPPELQETIQGSGGKVPPLTGADFLKKWGPQTTKDLSQRIMIAAGQDEEKYLSITAYVLQTSGAKPGTQALTTDTAVVVRSVVSGN